LSILMLFLMSIIVLAHDDGSNSNSNTQAGNSNSELHFSHPLIGESPSPDTKIRIDYFFNKLRDEERIDEHTMRLEMEYAFSRSFSIEMNIPYTKHRSDDGQHASHIDNIEVSFKFANFALKERKVLLGYGLNLELPSGNDRISIGSNHIVTIEPFFALGYKRDRLE